MAQNNSWVSAAVLDRPCSRTSQNGHCRDENRKWQNRRKVCETRQSERDAWTTCVCLPPLWRMDCMGGLERKCLPFLLSVHASRHVRIVSRLANVYLYTNIIYV